MHKLYHSMLASWAERTHYVLLFIINTRLVLCIHENQKMETLFSNPIGFNDERKSCVKGRFFVSNSLENSNFL